MCGAPGRSQLINNRLLWPGIMTLAMVALTIWLGVWQVQRLQWKTALLQEIDRGEAAEPVPLTQDPAPFSRVRIAGRLLDRTARYGTEVRGTASGLTMGSHVIQPLDGATPIMVDRGWAPEGFVPEAGEAVIEGYVRPAEHPVRFGNADDPSGRRFYALDPAAIGLSLGLPRVAPFTLVAMGPERPNIYPAPVQRLPRPVNNHLSYALTWFGLALSAIGVFAVYARKVSRA